MQQDIETLTLRFAQEKRKWEQEREHLQQELEHYKSLAQRTSTALLQLTHNGPKLQDRNKYSDKISCEKIVQLFRCPFCDIAFEKKTEMEVHRSEHLSLSSSFCSSTGPLDLSRNVPEPTVSNELRNKELNEKNDLQFKCLACAKSFKNKVRLRLHQLADHKASLADPLLSSPRLSAPFYFDLNHHLSIIDQEQPNQMMADGTNSSSRKVKVVLPNHEHLSADAKPIDEKKFKQDEVKNKTTDITNTSKMLKNTLHISKQKGASCSVKSNELIEKSKRKELRERFMLLLENHSCLDFACSVIRFRDHVKHTIYCTDGPQCIWYICQRIDAKTQHFKHCKDTVDCHFCQPYVNFNETKMMSLMKNLEKGCLKNTINRHDIGRSSNENIVNMVVRLAVNFGLVGENINSGDEEVPVTLNNSEEIIDVETVESAAETPVNDVIKIEVKMVDSANETSDCCVIKIKDTQTYGVNDTTDYSRTVDNNKKIEDSGILTVSVDRVEEQLQISEQKKVENEIVNIDQTIERLQNILHISKHADKAFSVSPQGKVKKEVIEQTATHVEADHSKETLCDVPHTVILCKDLLMKSTTASSERKPTTEPISESKRIELREQFVSLLEDHGCQDFTCSVITFRDHVRHANCCTDGPRCSWYICQRIDAKIQHFKHCFDKLSCLFCQPFANFNEVKMMSVITNLEKGCLLNTMNRYNIGPSSRNTIVNMAARLAVNFGLIGEIVNCDDDEVPDLVLDESEEIVDVEKVDPKDEVLACDTVKMKNKETTKVEEITNSPSESAAVNDNEEAENSEIPELVEIDEDVLRSLSLSSDDEGMLREWEMVEVDSDGKSTSDQKIAPSQVNQPVEPETTTVATPVEEEEGKEVSGTDWSDLYELMLKIITDGMVKTSMMTSDQIQKNFKTAETQDVTKVMKYKDRSYENLWCDFFERLVSMVQGIIEFAKIVPGFMKLSQDDQIELLKSCAFQLSVIRMSRYMDLSTGKILVTDEGLLLPEDAFYKQNSAEIEFVQCLFKIVKSIAELKLTDGQLGLYSAVILFNYECEGLTGVTEIRKSYEIIIFTLRNQLDAKVFDVLIGKIPDLHDLAYMHMDMLARFVASRKHIDLPALHKEIFAVNN